MLCIKCKKNKRAQNGRQRWCLDCRNKYSRKNRPAYAELTKDEKEKSNVRAYANVYQKRKKLTPQPCKMCGKKKTVKHHPDYKKPLKIVWLCENCHQKIHNK